MPLNDVSYTNPYTGESSTSGWAYAGFTAFDWESKTARFVYRLYASKTAAYAGLPPLKDIEIKLGSSPTPAVVHTVVTDPGTPPTLSEPDPETGETTVLDPGVPPTTEEVVDRVEIPGLPELVAANAAAYAALLGVLDTLALTLPEFAGATAEA